MKNKKSILVDSKQYLIESNNTYADPKKKKTYVGQCKGKNNIWFDVGWVSMVNPNRKTDTNQPES